MESLKRAHPMPHTFLQQITAWFQQISAFFPAIPPSMLLFFLVVAGFLAFAIVIFFLRLLGAIISALFGIDKRRHRAEWERRARLKALRQQYRLERPRW